MKRLLVVVAALLSMAVAGFNVNAASPPSPPTLSSLGGPGSAVRNMQPVVRHPDELGYAAKSDVMSRPLRDIPPSVSTVDRGEADNEGLASGQPVAGGAVDSVVQRILGPLAMPTPIVNFEGQYSQNGPGPPDTNGDVGRNHYIQIVNFTFEIYSKAGTPIYGPTNNNNLFYAFGGPCETRNDGDPVAVYDALADRWLLTWFTTTPPYMQCIAVSTSPDPTDTWYRYAFLDHNSATTLGDYSKLAVWPDAYYMTTDEWAPDYGDGNYAFNRDKMLRGDPTADVVYFHAPERIKLPSDLDGSLLPPAGSPNYMIDWYDNSPGQLAEYKFHVDWSNPLLSTYTGPFFISVADFAVPAPMVPQPGTTTRLPTLSPWMMHRLAYRNFGDHESLVVNHSVDGGGVAGIRWYELRDPNGPNGATVYQQGTYAPADGVYRWMGSIAMDRNQDIALGFSASNSSVYPNIRYAGRLPTDPLGTLGQGEGILFPGIGSEDAPPGTARWGDYSAMQIDPVDDCTFWYTTMYWGQTGRFNWRSRIGSFKFPTCTAQGSPTPVATDTPGASATPLPPTPTVCPGAITYTDSITNTDPTQTGLLGPWWPVSTCAAPKPVAGLVDTLAHHYKSYSYTNSSPSTACVTVYITQACGDNAIQSEAYLGSFDPNNIQANYLADGGPAGPSFQYSFSLGSGQTTIVVVSEDNPNLGCATYTLTIAPCEGSPVATATATATPAQRTSTPIASGTTTSTVAATATAIVTATSVSGTLTPGATSTPTPTSTPTECPIQFTDVPLGSTFYAYIRCLACRGIINGYPDGSFKPNANVTRGQLSKIVSNSARFSDPQPNQTFQDVPLGSTFQVYIGRLASRGYINGYPCGGPGEPCQPGNLPYFRPGNNATRGQISKIDANAAGFNDPPSGQQFEDVALGGAFYTYTYRLVSRGVMSGYSCGGVGEPCIPPANLPYFRPNANATRGQTSKIVANTFFPNCQTPARK